MIDINDVGDRLFSRKTVDIIRAESELMPNNHKKISPMEIFKMCIRDRFVTVILI